MHLKSLISSEATNKQSVYAKYVFNGENYLKSTNTNTFNASIISVFPNAIVLDTSEILLSYKAGIKLNLSELIIGVGYEDL